MRILKQHKWGTLMAIDGKKPYGIEVAYTIQGNFLYVIFNPRGRMSQCIKKNKNAAFKVCTADENVEKWEAVLVEGAIEKVTGPADIRKTFKALAQKFGYDQNLYAKMADKYAAMPAKSPVHRLPLKVMGGRSSS